jgi:co-chaperonin GroES (HSP10)
MKIRPRNNFVLVEVQPPLLPSERRTKGGIIVPISINEALTVSHDVGIVKEIGPKVDGLEVGNKVLFSKHAGNKIKDLETEVNYVLLEENQILATY